MKFLLPLFAAAVSQGAVIRDIPYVRDGDPLQKLDLHLPEAKSAGPLPVLVAIHGGGWSIGDKAQPGFVEPKTGWFLSQGFIVASVNYRLSPAVTHPAHIDDVRSALTWIRENVSRHGGDPRRVFLLGHSAGAHLAALAAVDSPRLRKAGGDPSGIRGVILLDGAGYDIPRQMAGEMPFARVESMYQDAFTRDPTVQRDASPVFQVAADPPPFLILHVARRNDAREQSELLADTLRKQGGKATVSAIQGKSHLTINRDLGKPGDSTTLAVAAFLETHR